MSQSPPSPNARRSRRLRGDSPESLTLPSTSTRPTGRRAATQQRPTRFTDHRPQTSAPSPQHHPPPPSGHFDFTSHDPPVPSPGFGSIGTMEFQQAVAEALMFEETLMRMRQITHPDNPSTPLDTPNSQPTTQLTTQPTTQPTTHEPPLNLQRADHLQSQQTATPAHPSITADLTSDFSLDMMEAQNAESQGARPSTSPNNLHMAETAIPPPNNPQPSLATHQLSRRPTPPPACVACCCEETPSESTTILEQPCRFCRVTYCRDCIRTLFITATKDPLAMPPSCCVMLQMHQAHRVLSPLELNEYRQKFEEWLAVDKWYCPQAQCSALISDRVLYEALNTDGPLPRPDVAKLVFARIINVTTARQEFEPILRTFRSCRTIPTPSKRIGADDAVPQDALSAMCVAARYKSSRQFLFEFNNILNDFRSSRISLEGREHLWRVTVDLVMREVCNPRLYPNRVLNSKELLPQQIACPSCRVPICTTCREIGHGATSCDTTRQDYEKALLTQFNYKQCPQCKTAVKKMFGCNHMLCICGTHWCWSCERLMTNCRGDCHDEDDLDDDDDSEAADLPEDVDSEAVDEVGDPVEDDQTSHVAEGPYPDGTDDTRAAASHVESVAPPQATNSAARIPADLDAGGYRRWAGCDVFGDEPPDVVTTVHTCEHSFQMYRPRHDKTIKLGSIAECNRCFKTFKHCSLDVILSTSPTPVLAARDGCWILHGQVASTGQAVHNSNPTVTVDEQSTKTGEIPPVRDSEGTSVRPVTATNAAGGNRAPPPNRLERLLLACKICNAVYCGNCIDFVLESKGVERVARVAS